jgi:superfamily II DNA or RNA helicase
MKLRPYQVEAIEAIDRAWVSSRSTVLVLATGLGKTVVFSHVIGRMRGRALVLAHREELIWQAARKIEQVTDAHVEIEMAEYRASASSLHDSHVVVSSIQTQCAGFGGAGRMARFEEGFDLIVVDECHHAPAASYRRVLKHYQSINPDVKVLGVTATPDRADKLALGSAFESVAYSYGIDAAIPDGWLCPIVQQPIHVEGLDYSSVRTVAGDFNGADLSAILERESMVHQFAHPTFEHIGRRRGIVFCASVKQAEQFAEILNRWRPNMAAMVSGMTPKNERRAILDRFSTGDLQVVCNCGVLTEGFDDPGVEVVVMARPTKSRALFTQMVGRATRTLPGVVDGCHDADGRAMAIAASAKPSCEVIDFVGVTGRHRLVTALDILGGKAPKEVVDRAREIIERGRTAMRPEDAIAQAEEELRAERERQEAEKRRIEAERALERARRQELRVKAHYVKGAIVDPFALFDIDRSDVHVPEAHGAELTHKQSEFLERAGIDPLGLSGPDARRIIAELMDRYRTGKCTYRQAKILRQNGYPTDISKSEASAIIDSIFAKRPYKGPAPRSVPSGPRMGSFSALPAVPAEAMGVRF